jgi:hypothetical protein
VDILMSQPFDSRGAQMQPDSVILSWNPSFGADGYSIFRNGAEVDFTTATKIKAPLSLLGVDCRFSVKAWNLTGGFSEEARTSSFVRGKAREVFLSDLPWTRSWSAFCRIIRDESWDGGALSIGEHCYAKGLFVHAPAEVEFDLGGVYRHFSCEAGLFTGLPGQCRCFIEGDSRILFESGILDQKTDPLKLELDITGVKNLLLRVEGLRRGPLDGRFIWANARLSPLPRPPRK